MSKRRDITDGAFATTNKHGLIYTEELGWIDLGHAQGNDARELKRKLNQEFQAKFYKELNGWYFPVCYSQEMGINKRLFGKNIAFRTGVLTQIMVRTCLSPLLKARVALTLMYDTAKRFEAWQNSLLFNWYTDSGFSVEDLVSDLVGFYRVFGTGPDPLWLARPVPYERAIQIWDGHNPIGHYKNTEFSPYLFNTNTPFKYGEPIKKELPAWMNYIKPLKEGFSGIMYNIHNSRPVSHYYNDSTRLNHELYSSFSSANSLIFSDSPLERPLFFLLNPHKPVARW